MNIGKKYEVAFFPKTFKNPSFGNHPGIIFLLSDLDSINLLSHEVLTLFFTSRLCSHRPVLGSTQIYKMYSPAFL